MRIAASLWLGEGRLAMMGHALKHSVEQAFANFTASNASQLSSPSLASSKASGLQTSPLPKT